VTSIAMLFCFPVQNFTEIEQLAAELWPKKLFLKWLSFAVSNFKNFDIWSRDCHRVLNLHLCTKFHQNWMTLPRDAMYKRGLCRHAVCVCPSVCLCVSHVHTFCQNE